MLVVVIPDKDFVLVVNIVIVFGLIRFGRAFIGRLVLDNSFVIASQCIIRFHVFIISLFFDIQIVIPSIVPVFRCCWILLGQFAAKIAKNRTHRSSTGAFSGFSTSKWSSPPWFIVNKHCVFLSFRRQVSRVRVCQWLRRDRRHVRSFLVVECFSHSTAFVIGVGIFILIIQIIW